MPYRSRRTYRSTRSAGRPKRTLQWSRGYYAEGTLATKNGSRNLAGNLFTDPVVRAQVQAGAPEVAAYDANIPLSIGVTLERLFMTVQLGLDIDNSMYLGVLRHPVDTTTYPLPSPLDQASSADWLFWRRMNAVPPFSNINDPAAALIISSTYVFDVKAKRRITEANQTIWLVWEANSGFVANEAIGVTSSTLFKGSYV